MINNIHQKRTVANIVGTSTVGLRTNLTNLIQHHTENPSWCNKTKEKKEDEEGEKEIVRKKKMEKGRETRYIDLKGKDKNILIHK